MDSITHIALGACIGELFVGSKVGRKAMLWGAVSQSFPDIDFIASFWMDTTDELLAHRGFTHSLLFAALLTPVLAVLAERWHRPHNISIIKWALFFGTEILLHIFLDAFNAYGTAWFEAANGWYNYKDYNPFRLRRSAGIGMRFFLPMFGLLGFDYGIGFDRIKSGQGLKSASKFTFMLGYEPE